LNGKTGKQITKGEINQNNEGEIRKNKTSQTLIEKWDWKPIKN